MTYSVVKRGSENTADYRLFFKNGNGEIISPWHDIPLRVPGKNNTFNAVVEIPRFTNHKMEISTKDPGNPIKQDTKNGILRFVKNHLPYHGYLWNYGALPQTWENPTHVDSRTNAKGDNDPLDICEIGQRIASRGEVLQVKILGAFALIDEGETDWKIICVNTADPMAARLDDLEDVEKYMPGIVEATRDWFATYKVNDGKPVNQFAFGCKPLHREFALSVIDEAHAFYKKLISDRSNKVLSYGLNSRDYRSAFEQTPPSGSPAALPEDGKSLFPIYFYKLISIYLVDKIWFGHLRPPH
ncbi:hypothetical protein Zmor_012212 [Zophobas morio]|uniref:inorganic diphosphatase n=1 Tax=Zophobas morio TaxID=2755281 RepID=A0AA38LYF8_9CUCU|nr:hypothetical protein Zmor_012212 [Zophobas morio]